MRNFIVGTDWWTDCDDAVALRMLARAHRQRKINLLGFGINACMEYSAASLEGFLNLEGVSDIPIGIDISATDFGGNPPYQKRLAEFACKYSSNSDAKDAVRLYRSILASAKEKIEIIEIGYLQVIAAVINSGSDDISEKTGIELIKAKVSKIWVMAGKWDEDGGMENNFARNERSRTAGDIFCRRCPIPVTFLGWEVGADVITGDSLQNDDFLYKALCDHGSSHGRMSWDPMLVLMAIVGDEKKAGYDTVRGTAEVDPITGKNYFSPDLNGKHRYVVKKKDNDYYKKCINSLIE